MKTLQEIKSELLHRCEDLYENYLVFIDSLPVDSGLFHLDNAGSVTSLQDKYFGFKEACEYLGQDLIDNIKQMEDRVYAERYTKSGIEQMLTNVETSGQPTQ